jgi:hypothetical protein
MDKKTLAGIAFLMGASGVVSAKPGVNLQALELLQENRISYEEFEQLMASKRDSGTWSNSSITDGTWSNSSITGDTWSNSSITDGTWSNCSLTDSTWSNSSVTGDSVSLRERSQIPAPQVAEGIED